MDVFRTRIFLELDDVCLFWSWLILPILLSIEA